MTVLIFKSKGLVPGIEHRFRRIELIHADLISVYLSNPQ